MQKRSTRRRSGVRASTLIVDAGVLYAQADTRDPNHDDAARVLRDNRGPLITSQAVVAEADHLIMSRLGVEVELAFLDDLADGTFVAECLTREEIRVAHEVARRYEDLRLGFADASLVVLAFRYDTTRVATFDERGFRAVQPLQGGAFTLLPADRA